RPEDAYNEMFVLEHRLPVFSRVSRFCIARPAVHGHKPAHSLGLVTDLPRDVVDEISFFRRILQRNEKNIERIQGAHVRILSVKCRRMARSNSAVVLKVW